MELTSSEHLAPKVERVLERLIPNLDFFLFLRDYLTLNPAALDRYNKLKRSHAGGGPEAYWKAKDQFLSQILRTEWE